MEVDGGTIESQAKRWCPLNDKEPATSLVALDVDCFGHLLLFLDSFEVMALIQTGNANIINKTQLRLSRFEYVVDYQQKLFDGVSSVKQLQWPGFLAQPLPLLHSIVIDALNVEFKIADFTTLTPTLRRLSLKVCNIRGKFGTSSDDILLHFNCPNLTRLSINTVRLINDDGTILSYVKPSDWVPALLKQCNQLSRLSIQNLCQTDPSCAHTIMTFLPPTLERLSTSTFLLSLVTHWPPHLHSLEVVGSTIYINNHIPTECLPSSITSVSIYRIQTHDVILPFLDKLPASLSRLAIYLEGKHATFGQWLVDAIPRFASLRVLEVSDPVFDSTAIDQTAVTDLSILPRSITRLSDVFAFYPTQWRNLPTNVRFVTLDTNYQWSDRGVCINGDDELVSTNMSHMPLTGDRLWLSGAIPDGRHRFPNVKSLGYDSHDHELYIPTKLYSLIDCNKLLRLDICIPNMEAFTWVPSSAVLPNLETFTLTCEFTNVFPPVNDIHAWITSLPRSLRCLSIFVNRQADKPVDNRGLLVLSNDALPSCLLWCNLKLPNYSLTLPTTLPQFLTTLEVRCHGFVPDFSNSHLMSLSDRLYFLSAKAYGSPLSLSVSAAGTRAFCAANRFRPIRQCIIKQ